MRGPAAATIMLGVLLAACGGATTGELSAAERAWCDRAKVMSERLGALGGESLDSPAKTESVYTQIQKALRDAEPAATDAVREDMRTLIRGTDALVAALERHEWTLNKVPAEELIEATRNQAYAQASLDLANYNTQTCGIKRPTVKTATTLSPNP